LVEEYDISVALDSGGYESQIGDEYTLREIYQFDRDYYQENDWAAEYVLPDQVPLADDSDKTIRHKVYDTISLSRSLHAELPADKQPRAVPVVQGHTREQIVDCLDAYRELDNVQKVGFGSFSTGGVNGGVNYLTKGSIELLKVVVDEAHRHDLDVHAFGVGGPTSIPILHYCGVDTFDSTGWMRSGGYGNAFFPLKSRFNVTHLRERSGPALFKEELREVRQETGHECPFCDSFDDLHDKREYRILHNLLVSRDTCEMVQELSLEEILGLMNSNSRYYGYLDRLINSGPVSH
jgi:queuine/archaeosine tRNA-ribosyltransferase